MTRTCIETRSADDSVQTSSEKSFGLIFAVFFTLAAFAPLFHGKPIRTGLVAIAGLLVLLAFQFPRVLRPLNRAWFKLGMLLHHVTNPIMLGIMFYCIITPIGVIMRIFGKDFLGIEIQKNRASYWIPRQQKMRSESLRLQF